MELGSGWRMAPRWGYGIGQRLANGPQGGVRQWGRGIEMLDARAAEPRATKRQDAGHGQRAMNDVLRATNSGRRLAVCGGDEQRSTATMKLGIRTMKNGHPTLNSTFVILLCSALDVVSGCRGNPRPPTISAPPACNPAKVKNALVEGRISGEAFVTTALEWIHALAGDEAARSGRWNAYAVGDAGGCMGTVEFWIAGEAREVSFHYIPGNPGMLYPANDRAQGFARSVFLILDQRDR